MCIVEKQQLDQESFENDFEIDNDSLEVTVDLPHLVFLWKRIHERSLPSPTSNSVSRKKYRCNRSQYLRYNGRGRDIAQGNYKGLFDLF